MSTIHNTNIRPDLNIPRPQSPEQSGQELLSRGNKTFEKSVVRSWPHHQSSDLKQLVRSVKAYQADPSKANAQKVQNAIDHWQNNHPKEVKKRGAQLKSLQTELSSKHPTLDRTHQQASNPATAKASSKSIESLLKQSIPNINKIGQYACTDAGTFVKKDNRQYNTIMSRLEAFHKDPTRLQANQKANMTSGFAERAMKTGQGVSKNQLNTIAQAVHSAKAGCCSTMAYAAAFELMKSDPQVRIEVVSHVGANRHVGTHCFVLLGRKEGSDLTDPSTWGSQTVVIDPWAASIGGRLQGTPKQPPITDMFPPTNSVFDNTKVD